MNLQEAIEHARQVADGCDGGDRDCAYQHDKLADWLEELKRYKATGLSPEEIEHSHAMLAALARALQKVSVDRLCELAQADQGGHVTITPEKVYQTDGVKIYESQVRKIIFETEGIAFDVDAIGKNVFLTREAAEAAFAARSVRSDAVSEM